MDKIKEILVLELLLFVVLALAGQALSYLTLVVEYKPAIKK